MIYLTPHGSPLRKTAILLSLFICSYIGYSQNNKDINTNLLEYFWQAEWITHSDITGHEYGVYHFKKNFELNDPKEPFIIHISADNRYKLYVNGKYAGNGPARGSLLRWRYETIDISPYLKKGGNTIVATVWNFGEFSPGAQISHCTGFILQGNSQHESVLNTSPSWAVCKDAAYSPIPVQVPGYYVSGPGEDFKASKHIWDLQEDINPGDWKPAKSLGKGCPKDCHTRSSILPGRLLYPRQIPPMEYKKQLFSCVRRSSSHVQDGFIKARSVTIEPNTTLHILIDQQHLTTAYPVLEFSRGKNSSIQLTYAESLYNDKQRKGNRNDIAGKQMIGNHDLITADGGENRRWESLWWRCFRYIELTIHTKDDPLVLDNLYSYFTAYPLQEKASFESDDPSIKPIWDICWRTQRLCTNETFFDTPYYEQLMYVGDTRVQALTAYYVSGDTSLWRKAIIDFSDSRQPSGLTLARYPSKEKQYIPTFSLLWIAMIHDYYMHTGDEEFVKSMIPGILGVLQFFQPKIDDTGMMKKVKFWNFVDYTHSKYWISGEPPTDKQGYYSILNLQFAYAAEYAARIFRDFGYTGLAKEYENTAISIKEAVVKYCWDETKGLMSDNTEKRRFSQQVNIMTVLTNAVDKQTQRKIMENILQNQEIAQATYYYRFYLSLALEKVGLGDEYLKQLSLWQDMLNDGLTTTREFFEPTRSDSHAWSASPAYFLLSLVSGIKPASPGFQTVDITPHLGKLNYINSKMLHPNGEIIIALKKDKNGIKGRVVLPETVSGTFNWRGKRTQLRGGENILEID